MKDTVIISAVRTPIGKFQGTLKSLSAPQLGAIVVKVTSAIAPGTGGPEAALVFGRAFFVILACLATAFVALVLIEERPLRTGIAEEPKA